MENVPVNYIIDATEQRGRIEVFFNHNLKCVTLYCPSPRGSKEMVCASCLLPLRVNITQNQTPWNYEKFGPPQKGKGEEVERWSDVPFPQYPEYCCALCTTCTIPKRG
jgi:hypothetical protein